MEKGRAKVFNEISLEFSIEPWDRFFFLFLSWIFRGHRERIDR